MLDVDSPTTVLALGKVDDVYYFQVACHVAAEDLHVRTVPVVRYVREDNPALNDVPGAAFQGLFAALEANETTKFMAPTTGMSLFLLYISDQLF